MRHGLAGKRASPRPPPAQKKSTCKICVVFGAVGDYELITISRRFPHQDRQLASSRVAIRVATARNGTRRKTNYLAVSSSCEYRWGHGSSGLGNR